ncbi:MAG: Ppx/GppA family phosphatase [Oxalobacter sp.]|nr:MAG: Ppx/GppA family phosphatase [Oxalobacter sp.]
MLAAVDLGSNSFRLHVGYHDGKSIQVLRTARVPNRLAFGMEQSGNLSSASMQYGLNALTHLRDVLSEHLPDEVRIVGTNTLRVANNSAEFISSAEKTIGLPIEVISGEEEARLIYVGIANQLSIPGENRLIVDIGGGSTELIIGKGQDIARAESIGIGTVDLRKTFFPVGELDKKSFDAAILYARSRFENFLSSSTQTAWTNVYGSSGTMRAIGDIVSKNNIGSETLTVKTLRKLMAILIEYGNVDSIKLNKLQPGRTDSIVGGLAIMIGLMEELGIDAIVPVEGGLRLGVMWDLHLRANERDRREQSVKKILARFSCDETRANRVAEYTSALYAQLKPATDAHVKLLRWSALLHEVGLAISPTNYHKHGAYMIENGDLPGFTSREQRLMAKLIVGQKGNLRKVAGVVDNFDFMKAILAIRLAVMFTQARVDADFNLLRVRLKSRIELELLPSMIAAHPTLPYWIEREQLFWREIGIDFLIKEKIS